MSEVLIAALDAAGTLEALQRALAAHGWRLDVGSLDMKTWRTSLTLRSPAGVTVTASMECETAVIRAWMISTARGAP